MIGLLVGVLDGSDVTGWNVGFLEGSSVVGFVEGGEDGGKVVGRSVGLADGKLIGAADVGLFEGSLLGGEEGLDEGIFVGRLVGFSVLGRRVIGVGRGVGRGVGSLVGHLVGFSVLGRRVIGVRLGLGRGVGSLVGFTGCCDGLRDFDVGVGGCDGCRDGIGEGFEVGDFVAVCWLDIFGDVEFFVCEDDANGDRVGMLLFFGPPDSIVGEDEDGAFDRLSSDPSRRYVSSSVNPSVKASSSDDCPPW